jgi:hypothetical protein
MISTGQIVLLCWVGSIILALVTKELDGLLYTALLTVAWIAQVTRRQNTVARQYRKNNNYTRRHM